MGTAIRFPIFVGMTFRLITLHGNNRRRKEQKISLELEMRTTTTTKHGHRSFVHSTNGFANFPSPPPCSPSYSFGIRKILCPFNIFFQFRWMQMHDLKYERRKQNMYIYAWLLNRARLPPRGSCLMAGQTSPPARLWRLKGKQHKEKEKKDKLVPFLYVWGGTFLRETRCQTSGQRS